MPAPSLPPAPLADAPDWPAEAIWYQVFPERFANGCPASNPTAEDAQVPADRFPAWHIRPWEQPWYALDDWGQPVSGNRTFFSTVYHRRYGGDLVGLRAKLPYLRELGVNALYLNPIFHAPSLHKYDATSLHHVDPTLGPDRAGDLALLAAAHETPDPATWVWTAADRFLLDLLDEAHALGFHVILDGVFNHCGRSFFAFRDLLARGRASSYANWFQIRRWHPAGTFDYAAWDGPNGSLPAFARAPGDDDLAPGPRRYIFDVTSRWVRPAPDGVPCRGIDGWRLDVAYCLPHGFWRAWHDHLRSLLPDAYTTAELVGPSQDYVRPGEFAAAMNYEWLFPTLGFFTPSPRALDADAFMERTLRLHARHPFPTLLRMQNLLESHDTGRVLTLFQSSAPPFDSWEPYFSYARQQANPDLDVSAPGSDALGRLRLAAFWQFTAPGAPMLYYGTELGLWGANDPSCRQPMPWTRHPGSPLFAYYQRLCALRSAQPALRRGTFQFLPAPSPRAVHYTRTLAPTTLHAWINCSDVPLPLPVPVSPLFATCPLPPDASLAVLPPFSALLHA